MSAPPIAAVVVNPFVKLRAAFAERHMAATAGAPGAMVTKAPIVAALAAKRLELMTWRPGRLIGLDPIRPESLKKATREPVNVTPPENLLAG